MKTYDELLEERGRLVNQMREISAANPDGFNSETKEKYEKLEKAQAGLKEQADRLYNEEKLAAEMAAGSFSKSAQRKEKSHRNTFGRDETLRGQSNPEYFDAMDSYLRRGQFSNVLETDGGSPDTGAGYLLSDYFDQTLREIVDDVNALRPYCNVITTKGDHNIRVESSLGAFGYITESGSYGTDDPTFTNVSLGAFKCGGIVKVSEEMVQDSDFDLENYLARNFGRRIALIEEEKFIKGAGTTEPTGIISGAGTVTKTESPLVATVSANTLLDVYYGLQRQYRSNATWLISDTTARQIRGIVDGNDNFIWQPGLQAGQPDRILGRPYITSAYMPDAGESPLASPVVFGDLMNYTIADRTGFRIQRLNELYAANGQVGFRGYVRHDAKTVQSAGIKKIAAF